MPAQAAPASVAPHDREQDVRQRCSCRRRLTPSQFATTRPTKYWPCPPMLNMPQRKANATASPVRMSVVVWSSVWVRLYAAMRTDVRRRMEDPVQAGAVEDVAVGEQRVMAGRNHDQATNQEGENHRRYRHRDAAGALA